MSFGLRGAPATFQRLVDRVLCAQSDLALDNTVIYSNTWEEHLQYLKVVFECLHSAGLTVNAAKCTFTKAEIEYLSYVVGKGVIKPQIQKV